MSLSVKDRLTEQRRRQVQKRERYFDRFVLDAAMEAVPQFESGAVSCVESLQSDLASIEREQAAGEPGSSSERVADAAARAYDNLQTELFNRMLKFGA